MLISYSPSSLYHLTKLLFPEGSFGKPIANFNVSGMPMLLSCATHPEEKAVTFRVEHPNTYYTRRIPKIFADGSILDDMSGTIPEDDAVHGENVIAETTDELLPLIFDALLGVLGSSLHK